jgi:hypothetical protein
MRGIRRRHNESRVSAFLCKSIHDLCMLAHLSLGLCVAMELSFTDISLLSSDTTAQELPIGYPNEPGILRGPWKPCVSVSHNSAMCAPSPRQFLMQSRGQCLTYGRTGRFQGTGCGTRAAAGRPGGPGQRTASPSPHTCSVRGDVRRRTRGRLLARYTRRHT